MQKIKLLLVLFFIEVFSVSVIAQTDIEAKMESWLDSVFIAKEIDWDLTKSDFLFFSNANFKKANSIEKFFLALVESTSPKREKPQELIIGTFDRLLLFEQNTSDLLPAIDGQMLSLIKENGDWCVMDNFKSAYFSIRRINYFAPKNFNLNLLCNCLLNLKYKIQSESLFEKISVLIVLQKIYNTQVPKSFEEIASFERNNFKECEVKSDYNSTTDSTYETTENETEPCFLGGNQGMVLFIREMVQYPELAKEMGEEGTIYVQFVVNTDGSIADICVLKSPSKLLSQEAIRTISAMPEWMPGSQNGKAVRVRYVIPIRFSFS